MIYRILILSALVFLSACNIESKFFSNNAIVEGNKIWAFIQFHVPDKAGVLEDYYYFGLINENLYKKIKSHEVNEGLIFMEKVKYWNNDNVIETYSDDLYTDEMAFRIEHIVRFELVKKEPVDGFSYPSEEISNEEI